MVGGPEGWSGGAVLSDQGHLPDREEQHRAGFGEEAEEGLWGRLQTVLGDSEHAYGARGGEVAEGAERDACRGGRQ
ncbi:hypothetical protein GCM10023335_75020 [Streptomyces siamensis]|uniref:Uncharacterized protein n=1 Tax=Streptomyces siamensis TaxID=1274986 RepID=A0ABP9JKP4_9ACTN